MANLTNSEDNKLLKSLKSFCFCRASLMTTSAILGMGGAPLWSAKCTYLTISGNMRGQKINKKGQDLINQYFGIFFFLFQSSGVWGNLMSSLIFGQDSNIGTVELNTLPASLYFGDCKCTERLSVSSRSP